MSDRQQAAIQFALDRVGTGLCMSCGEPVDTDARYAKCRECNKRNRLALGPECWKKNRRKSYNRQKGLKQKGQCSAAFCKEESLENNTKCKFHRDQMREAGRRYRAKKRSEKKQ